MEPWYRVVQPRKELREGRSLDPSEFAVHLEQVVAGTAPDDYKKADKFFARNYFSKALVEYCGMVLRRLNGATANTAPVLSLITQFGGGKTHALTAFYHLCSNGAAAKKFAGVPEMMKAGGLKEIPEAKIAIFVGNSWDAHTGRETPWLDVADQLAGDKGRKVLGDEARKRAPGTNAIGELLSLVDEPILILFDETLNYVGRYKDQATQFHSFVQNLTSALTSAKNAVGIFSLPASPTEMTDELREHQQRLIEEMHEQQSQLTKIVGRVGKDLVANDAFEVSEIVRRRLFEDAGRDSMRKAVARQYAKWVFERRDRLPSEWGQLPEDEIRAQFEACYPFHPATLTVFQRKWTALPQYQQTRSTLAMLGMWVSCAYREGYARARREPLMTLGSAPLADRDFLSAVLRQMGEGKLQAAIHADIASSAGQPRSHAEALDEEISDGAGKSAIHQRVATALFFESCGGQTDRAAHLPELYFAIGDPDTETTLIHTSVQALENRCYYLRPVGRDGWRFGHSPTLRKVHADKKAALDPDEVKRRMREVVQSVFKQGAEIDLCLFPKDATAVPDRAALTLAVMSPDEMWQEGQESGLNQRLTEWTKHCGLSPRQYPGAVLWIAAESSGGLRTACEDWLAWQAVADYVNRGGVEEIEVDDQRRITRELNQSKAQIEERVWSSYSHLLLWDAAANGLKHLPLGQLHPSEARTLTSAILARLRHDSLLSREIGASYVQRNFPPALKESGAWTLGGLKAAFFQGQFTRLERADDALRQMLVRAVKEGSLGVASGKSGERYERVWYREDISPAEITFDHETYVLTAAKAKQAKEALTQPASSATTEAAKPTTPTEKPEDKTAKPQPPGTADVAKLVEWKGVLPRDQWNLFSLKVLTRLSQAEQIEILVQVRAKLKDMHTVEQLNAALKELGIADKFTEP
jgi:hypothetical protein